MPLMIKRREVLPYVPPENQTLLNWMFNELKHLPMSTERPCTIPSRSEVKRWLKNGSVIINGEKIHDPNEIKDYDIFTLVFFPKGKRRTTYQ